MEVTFGLQSDGIVSSERTRCARTCFCLDDALMPVSYVNTSRIFPIRMCARYVVIIG